MASSLTDSLRVLADLLKELNFQFPPGDFDASAWRDRMVRRLTDHLAARGRDLDAPLVAVLVGSSGVGKTTIMNSLVGEVGSVSVQRPTTFTPMMVHHPQDELWLAADRILGGFDKIRLEAHDSTEETSPTNRPILQVKTSEKIRPGIILVDTPDLDSYVETNRRLALQLLDGADLWIFVTTAQRYAESQGIKLLREAGKRHVAMGVVLNRVGHGSLLDSKKGLSEKLDSARLGDTPIFAITEGELEGGMLPDDDVETLRKWLDGLAGDTLLRTATARQTLFGSLLEVLDVSKKIAASYAEESEKSQRAKSALDQFANNMKSAWKDRWLKTPIFQGLPVSRFNRLAQAVMEEDVAENSWLRQRLKWRRSLYGIDLRLQPTKDAASHVLVAAQEGFLSEIQWQTSEFLQDLNLDTTKYVAPFSQGEAGSLYSSWYQELEAAIEAKSPSLPLSKSDTTEAIYIALLMELFDPIETVPQDFLEHFLSSPDLEELRTKLKASVVQTVEAWAKTIGEALQGIVPLTDENPVKAKEITKLITELQEQWLQ